VTPDVLTTVVMGTIQVAAFDAARGAPGSPGRSGVRAGLLRLLAAPPAKKESPDEAPR
jgi:hypothetical protein